MEEKSKYQITENDYKTFIEINGTKMTKTPAGIYLKENKAKYYIISKNNDFISDFVIYSEDNWITLARYLFNNTSLINSVFSFLKEKDYDYLITYISLNEEDLINSLEKNYNITKESVKQGNYDYYRIRFNLK